MRYIGCIGYSICTSGFKKDWDFGYLGAFVCLACDLHVPELPEIEIPLLFKLGDSQLERSELLCELSHCARCECLGVT